MRSPRRVSDPGRQPNPLARSNGAYSTASNQAMLTVALEGLIETLSPAWVTAGGGGGWRGAQALT